MIAPRPPRTCLTPVAPVDDAARAWVCWDKTPVLSSSQFTSVHTKTHSLTIVSLCFVISKREGTDMVLFEGLNRTIRGKRLAQRPAVLSWV